MTNLSGIKPTEYKCLISPIVVANKIGSIFIPDEHKDREQFAQMQGTLVAVSPLAFTYADDAAWGDAEKPKPGDKVMYAKFAGAAVKGMDGKDYRIVNDKDIAAVLT
jgi:co-chaperonin GroES (HSP10)